MSALRGYDIGFAGHCVDWLGMQMCR